MRRLPALFPDFLLSCRDIPFILRHYAEGDPPLRGANLRSDGETAEA
jgi:hypothetical protein